MHSDRTTTRARWRAIALLAGLTLLLGALVGCDPTPPGFCPDIGGLDKWVWAGTSTDSISDPAKWNHDGPDGDGFPGGRNDQNDVDDYVCINPNTAMTIQAGESMHLQVLDSAGTLNVATGGKVELRGDPTSLQSFVRHVNLSGELFGIGVVTVRSGGTFRWTSTVSGAATMSTRESNAIGAGMPSVPGRTVIGQGASLVLDGTGVNLFDGRIIDNDGTTTLTGADAYIAADHGTTFRNRGVLALAGDGDYAEGFSRGIAGLSRLINTGLIRKIGGTGASVLDAAYSVTEASEGPGSAEVSTGTLSIRSADAAASVTPSGSTASAFGTAGCAGTNAACLAPAVTPNAPQYASVALPAASGASTVDITEAPYEGGKGNPIDLDVPTETASAVGTSPGPMVLHLALDATLLAPGDTASSLTVTHDAVVVPDCTGGVQAECVDRAASMTTGGDVVLVVLTSSNGRWRIV